MINNKRYKVIYIKGRPFPHPIHQKYGTIVSDEEIFIDNWVKWYGLGKSKLFNYFAWIINAIILSFKIKNNTILFSDGMQLSIIPVRYISMILFKRVKLVALVANETLYFIESKYYTGLSLKLNKMGFGLYNDLICIGDFQTNLAIKIAGDETHIHTIYNGLDQQYIDRLQENIINTDSKELIFVSNGGSEFRVYYKGLDLMLLAFERAKEKISDLTFTIVGDWGLMEIEKLLNIIKYENRKDVFFTGRQSDISKYLKYKSIYFHCSRGDAFPTTILESMNMGLIPIVSNVTGLKNVIEQIDEKLITTLEIANISNTIIHVINLSHNEKMKLSEKSKMIMREYTETKALDKMKSIFVKLTQVEL